MPPRKILHLDLDAFFCAVEEHRDPDLKGKAFAVGGRPEHRGVVASCSYPARQLGIHSAMPMSRAVRLCPHLIIVPARHGVYGEVSDQVMARLHHLTPFVEQLSIDEAFLDVTMYHDPAEQIARHLQSRINSELDLPCSLGVASNKLLAKAANDVGKKKAHSAGPPNTITIVPPGEEAAFLAHCPSTRCGALGKTAEQLQRLGIRRIGDLARWSASDLERRLGKHGADLCERARGLDERPVETEHETKSISKETTFTKDVNDADSLIHTLRALSDGVGRRTRKAGLRGATIHLKLRWGDFTTLTRQLTLPHPSDLDDDIYAAARQLFDANWPRGKRVRLIGVGSAASTHRATSWDCGIPP
jgi:DNA polymerase-4